MHRRSAELGIDECMSFILFGEGGLEIKVLVVWSEKEEFGFKVKRKGIDYYLLRR